MIVGDEQEGEAMQVATIERIKEQDDLGKMIGLELIIDKVIIPIRSKDEQKALQNPSIVRHLVIPCNTNRDYANTLAHQALAAVERADVLLGGDLGEHLYSHKKDGRTQSILSYHFLILYTRYTHPTHLGQHIVADAITTLCRNVAEGDIAILVESTTDMPLNWINAIREGAERARRVVYFYTAQKAAKS